MKDKKNKKSFFKNFLLELYERSKEFGEEFFDTLIDPPRTWYEVFHPEYQKLKRRYEKEMTKKAFRNLIYYLKKKGLIKGFKKEERYGWLLTEKGKEKVLQLKEKFGQKKKRKDGKWIMVIFDVPEKIRIKREIFRTGLQELGFQMLQKSIWISPYDVLEKTKKLIEKYFLKSYTKILLIEEIQIQS